MKKEFNHKFFSLFKKTSLFCFLIIVIIDFNESAVSKLPPIDKSNAEFSPINNSVAGNQGKEGNLS